MTLARGREVALIPGPSILPDRVLNAMHRAAIDTVTVIIYPTLFAGVGRVDMVAGHAKDVRDEKLVVVLNDCGIFEVA